MQMCDLAAQGGGRFGAKNAIDDCEPIAFQLRSDRRGDGAIQLLQRQTDTACAMHRVNQAQIASSMKAVQRSTVHYSGLHESMIASMLPSGFMYTA